SCITADFRVVSWSTCLSVRCVARRQKYCSQRRSRERELHLRRSEAWRWLLCRNQPGTIRRRKTTRSRAVAIGSFEYSGRSGALPARARTVRVGCDHHRQPPGRARAALRGRRRFVQRWPKGLLVFDVACDWNDRCLSCGRGTRNPPSRLRETSGRAGSRFFVGRVATDGRKSDLIPQSIKDAYYGILFPLSDALRPIYRRPL